MRMLQKFLGFVVLFLFVAVSATGALAQQQKRLAFVIGNAAYPSGALATPANDAGLIAQTLQAAGFDVVGARDVDQESLRGAYRDFLAKVSAAGPDAVVFVYLAGHGAQFEGENYFLPVDAKIANPADVPIQAVRISDLTRPLAALPTKVNIVVLDAARPNDFPQWDQPLAGGLALVDPDPNMLIAFNAAPGTAAPEGKGPYGAYAQSLAEMMRDGGLSLEDVFDRTRLRVNEVTQGAEVPWDASKVDAPFVFFDRAPDAPAPKVSEAESQADRTREIRDFDAHDAYVAALDRDTMRGYEDFLVAYPHDPMARRVRAIIAARREAITWRQTWMRDTPEAYWSYLERYPHGPHAWDARRRLEHFDAELEPPPSFSVIVYDVPPPPPEEIVYVDRPVLYFDDPDFDFEPPPPVAVIFLPPPPPDFVVLAPPPPPVGIFVLPSPAFVPFPRWINPPHDIVPPPDNIIFNNIHNTTVINNTTINENNQAGQGGGLTTSQKLTAGAVGLGAAALATKVALPPLLQKRAALQQGKQPGLVAPLGTPLSKTLSTDHALPGANGKTLPLVNGKTLPRVNGKTVPLANGKTLPLANGKTTVPLVNNGKPLPLVNGKPALADRHLRTLGKQGEVVTGQGAGAQTGNKGKFHRLPTVNGAPVTNGPTIQDKLGRNSPTILPDQNGGKPKRLTRKDLAAGATLAPNGQGGDSGKKFRKLTGNGGGAAGAEVNVQHNLKVNKPNLEVLSRQERPQFHVQPKLQLQPQERRLVQQPRQQPQQANKRPTCGHPGEPPCKQ
ncbi:peptidase C14 caspase catalytic subunit p20 [Mesorhizobium sp. LCM 4577]|uniref:caspase family protein n=1 Tax=Mesorhizobium sp. LCM 4577 TaxID=1848288 RepID=UPI0008DA55BE|nr:caspase domain-containing protein [Mesorhizobium sp. LCM 4577]OHV62446.1 peptidase C14 caspase catalytic subunit p20 [Mesorhizobium sp. LCM 4577]